MATTMGYDHGGAEHQTQKSDAAYGAPAAAENQRSIVALPVPGDLDSIATHPPRGTPLSEDAARTLTDAIRRDATALWMMLLRAFEGNAHGSLGYASWGEYCEAELQIDRVRAYRLIGAARVAEIVQSPMGDSESQSPVGDSQIPSERVARELAPLLDDPDSLRDTYREAVETAPRDATGAPKVTAAHVRETVERREQATEPRDVQPSSNPPRTQATVTDAVRHVVTVIRDGGTTDAIGEAITAAQRVLSRRRMGTSPEALAECIASLLGVMPVMLRDEP